MVKKGQVTVFIIVGILILAVLAAVLFFNKQSTTPSLPDNRNLPLVSKVQSTQQFIDKCLQGSLEDALVFSSSQGGYVVTPLVKLAIRQLPVVKNKCCFRSVCFNCIPEKAGNSFFLDKIGALVSC